MNLKYYLQQHITLIESLLKHSPIMMIQENAQLFTITSDFEETV